MRTYFQYIVVGVLLIVGVMGCNDSEQVAPTSSVGITASSSSFNAGNFWVGRGQDKYGVYAQDDMFQVNVPAGAYLLTYSVSQDGVVTGVFTIVFSSEEGAYMGVGLLPGDTLEDVTILLGEIPEDTSADMEQDGVFIYQWPGMNVFLDWTGVFIINAANEIIVLIEDGEISEEFLAEFGFSIEEITMEPVTETERFTVSASVVSGCGSVSPVGKQVVPEGASRSYKFSPCTITCEDGGIEKVTINGTDVTSSVQCLGNGQGHLVVHDIRWPLAIYVTFAPELTTP